MQAKRRKFTGTHRGDHGCFPLVIVSCARKQWEVVEGNWNPDDAFMQARFPTTDYRVTGSHPEEIVPAERARPQLQGHATAGWPVALEAAVDPPAPCELFAPESMIVRVEGEAVPAPLDTGSEIFEDTADDVVACPHPCRWVPFRNP